LVSLSPLTTRKNSLARGYTVQNSITPIRKLTTATTTTTWGFTPSDCKIWCNSALESVDDDDEAALEVAAWEGVSLEGALVLGAAGAVASELTTFR